MLDPSIIFQLALLSFGLAAAAAAVWLGAQTLHSSTTTILLLLHEQPFFQGKNV
jgi:hypothetical protein